MSPDVAKRGRWLAAITLAVLLAASNAGSAGVARAAPAEGGESGWPGLSILWSWIGGPRMHSSGIDGWIGDGASDASQPVTDPDGAEPPEEDPTAPPDEEPPPDQEETGEP